VSRAFGLGVSAPSLDGVEDGTGDGGRGIEHAKLGSDGDTGSERDGGGVRVLMLKSSIGGGVDRASLGDGKDVDGSSESRERKYAAPSKSATSEGGVSTSATGSSLSCTEGEASDLKSLTGSCCVGSVVLFLASHSRLIRIAAVICLASSSPSLLASPESSSVTGVKTASDRSRSCSWTLRSFGGRRPRSRRAASRFSFEANVFGGTGIFEERFPGAERSGDGVRSLVVKRRSIAWDLEGWTVFESACRRRIIVGLILRAVFSGILVGVGSRAVASTAFSFTESIAILTVPRFEPLLRMLPNRFETGNENGFRREGGFDAVESGSGVDLKLSTSSENLDPITCVVADMTGMEKVVSMW
jgi:hypothetical protein